MPTGNITCFLALFLGETPMMAPQLCSPPEANGEPTGNCGVWGEGGHNLRIPGYKEEKEPALELKALTDQSFLTVRLSLSMLVRSQPTQVHQRYAPASISLRGRSCLSMCFAPALFAFSSHQGFCLFPALPSGTHLFFLPSPPVLFPLVQ